MLLGKGNMGEWAFSPTFSLSSVAGAVRNPYDLDRTPAGSSGGPAAGVSHASLILSRLSLHCIRTRTSAPETLFQPLYRRPDTVCMYSSNFEV